MKRIIGLTGGIGTGKTTVSNYLAQVYQLIVLDADIYAREAVQPGSSILSQIVERYGTAMLLADGTLNRHQLSDLVFSHKEARHWLEQLIHPDVRRRMVAAIEQLPADSPVVLVVPLLFEAGMTDLVTETWVVSCTTQQQIERLMQRNGYTLEQAQARMNSQLSLEEKVARADVVLDNSSTPEALLKQVDQQFVNTQQNSGVK